MEPTGVTQESVLSTGVGYFHLQAQQEHFFTMAIVAQVTCNTSRLYATLDAHAATQALGKWRAGGCAAAARRMGRYTADTLGAGVTIQAMC